MDEIPDITGPLALPVFRNVEPPEPPEPPASSADQLPPVIPIPTRTKKSRRRKKAKPQPQDGEVLEPAANAVGVGGQPYVITPQIEEVILGYIGTGAYTEVAVEAAGINLRSHYIRMQGDPAYALAIRKARAFSEIAMGARVNAGKTGHRGALAVLERTRPERWAHKQYIGFDRRHLGELSDGDLKELLPHAIRAVKDRSRNTDANTIDITSEPVNSGSDG